MNCAECKGKGYVKLFRHARMQCLECGGSGIVSPPRRSSSCAEYYDHEADRNEAEMDAAGVPEFDASDPVKKTDMD